MRNEERDGIALLPVNIQHSPFTICHSASGSPFALLPSPFALRPFLTRSVGSLKQQGRICLLSSVNMASYYDQHARQLKRDLAAEVPTEALRDLHHKRPLLHALVAFANVAALLLAGVAIVRLQHWYFWLPCAVVAGFAVFDFTVLLHEV